MSVLPGETTSCIDLAALAVGDMFTVAVQRHTLPGQRAPSFLQHDGDYTNELVEFLGARLAPTDSGRYALRIVSPGPYFNEEYTALGAHPALWARVTSGSSRRRRRPRALTDDDETHTDVAHALYQLDRLSLQ